MRPRAGDFCYSDDDVEVMLADITAAKANGAKGIVSGILRHDGRIDRTRTARLVEASRPLPFTFHRAFDLAREPELDLEVLIQLGVARVLTSGGAPSAPQGIEQLVTLVRHAAGRIGVLPGGGLNADNVQKVLSATAVTEFHGSASRKEQSQMTHRTPSIPMSAGFFPSDYEMNVCDADKVASMLMAARLG